MSDTLDGSTLALSPAACAAFRKILLGTVFAGLAVRLAVDGRR